MMDNQTQTLIYQIMHDYWKKGRKCAYKHKQMKRLISILDEIMKHEISLKSNVQRIKTKHIIRYYQRHTDETNKTLKEKYSILDKFFSRYNSRIKVPKPDLQKCLSQQTHVDKP